MKMSMAKPSKLLSMFNNKGFTLVEMILAFSIFLIIASFIPVSIHMIYANGQVDERLQKMEWEVFIAQVKKEIRMSNGADVNSNHLLLKNDEQIISYERYGQSIRRQVGMKGHEIMLQNVKDVKFEKTIQGIKISVQDIYNQSESRIIHTLISEEG